MYAAVGACGREGNRLVMEVRKEDQWNFFHLVRDMNIAGVATIYLATPSRGPGSSKDQQWSPIHMHLADGNAGSLWVESLPRRLMSKSKPWGVLVGNSGTMQDPLALTAEATDLKAMRMTI